MKKRELLLSASAGAAAGFLNGLLGAGGGVILYYLFPHYLEKSELEVGKRLAYSLGVTVPIGALAACFVGERLANTGEVSFCFISAGAPGGVIGALMMKRMPSSVLSKIFAAVLLFGGLRMLFF